MGSVCGRLELGRNVIALGIAIISCGCATSVPTASARRSFFTPDGEHHLEVGLVSHAYSGPDDGWNAPSTTFVPHLGYRYGLSDDLNLVFPLVLAKRVPLGETRELGLLAGLANLGYGTRYQHTFSGDPRDPNTSGSAIFHEYLLGATLRFQLGPEDALLLRTYGMLGWFWVRVLRISGHLSAAWTRDLAPWLGATLAMTAEVRDELDVGHPRLKLMFGAGSGGGGPLGSPLFSVHVTTTLDLTVSPFVSVETEPYRLSFGGLSGVDVHFD